MAEDKQKTIRCPRCNYERAEIHNLIIAGTVRKIGETIICPKCQKRRTHNEILNHSNTSSINIIRIC